MQEIFEAINTYGVMIVMCGLFVWQYLRQVSYNEKREDKLYTVIENMTQTLPDIKESCDKLLPDIKNRCDRILDNIRR